MKKFICYSKAKELFDVNGKSMGMSTDRVLFYVPSIGRKRVYRSAYPNSVKRYKVFAYQSEETAKRLCDDINEAYNDDFVTLEIEG